MPRARTNAWLYVAARAAHTLVHAGRNQLRPRIVTYFGSWGVLVLMWIAFVAGVWRSA